MKIFRILLSVTGLLVLVVTMAVISLMVFIDPNKLKPVIAQEVKQQTGYDVVIDGKFSWSFYPRIGVKVEHMALRVPTQKTAFLDLHNVTFVTDLSALMQGTQKFRGDIYIADVNMQNMHAKDAHVSLSFRDQTLTLQPITAELYDGKFDGVAHGSNLSGVPQWDFNARVTDVNLQRLIQDTNGNNGKIKLSGTGKLTFNVTTKGKSADQILNNLNGTGDYSIKNGIVDGIDVNYLIKTADAVISKQPLSIPSDLHKTEFEALTGTTNINSGVVETKDLTLISPAFITRGTGNINLMFQTINLQLQVTPQKEAKTQWAIPMLVTGELSRPDVRLDTTELNIMIAKEELTKVKTKVKDEIKRHISGDAGKVLENLLGN